MGGDSCCVFGLGGVLRVWFGVKVVEVVDYIDAFVVMVFSLRVVFLLTTVPL